MTQPSLRFTSRNTAKFRFLHPDGSVVKKKLQQR